MKEKILKSKKEYRKLRKSIFISRGIPENKEDSAKWRLCKSTKRSHADLVACIGKCAGNRECFLREIGFSPQNVSYLYRIDSGYWLMLCTWIKLYIQKWTEELENAVNDLVNTSPSEEILETVSNRFGISKEALLTIMQDIPNLALFTEAFRPAVAVLAEANLQKQILVDGNTKVSEWYLSRVKRDIFGDSEKTMPPQKDLIIQVVEKEKNPEDGKMTWD